MRNKVEMELRSDQPGPAGSQMKIGEVSKLAGVGIEALRFYEKSGLLDRPGRTYSGYRVYGEEVLERIAFIKKAQVLGFSLDEIGSLIKHKQKGESPCEEVRQIVQMRLEELEQKIEQMKRYRRELTATLKEWDGIGHSDGHVCGLIESSQIEHPVDGRKHPGRGRREKNDDIENDSGR